MLLQWIAGGFYLLQKIFLSFSERADKRGDTARGRHWSIAAWSACLVGLPAWVVIFVGWRNWIAAAVEASGGPAMVLGLAIAIRGTEKKSPRWLDLIAFVCAVIGFAYSVHDFGGINTPNQWLEIVTVAGFLGGTYRLAKKHLDGYLWLVPMHLACGSLLWIQDLPWLVLQQVASLGFVADAYLTKRQRLATTDRV